MTTNATTHWLRRWGVPLALLVAVTVALAACDERVSVEAPGEDAPAGENAPADEEAADGTTTDRVERVRLAGGEYGYPSPFGWNRGPGRMKATYVFDTLVWRDGRGEIIPWIAADWEASDDATVWTFELRDDVTWHDGAPLSADDVAFSFRYMTGETGAAIPTQTVGAMPGLGALLDDVEAVDEHTVEIRLAEPHAAFLEWVASEVLIIPERVWADVDEPARYQEPDATLGTGPYELVKADTSAGTYLFAANDDFFLGRPVVERLEFVPAPDDEVLALERGSLDLASVAAGAPEAQIEAAVAEDGIERLDAPGEWNLALHTNVAAGHPYDEPAFRRALAYAIDEAALVERVYDGAAQVGSAGGLAPTHPQLAEGLPEYPRDLERMADELAEIGYAHDDEAVIDADGEAVALTLAASARDDQRVVELVAEDLRAAGFTVDVDVRDPAGADERLREGAYEVALVGYGNLGRDADFLRLRFSSLVPSDAFNRAAGFADDTIDEVAAAQLREIDEDARLALLADLQARIAEQLPVRSLIVPDQIALADTRLLDWDFTRGCAPCGAQRNKLLHVRGDLAPPDDAR